MSNQQQPDIEAIKRRVAEATEGPWYVRSWRVPNPPVEGAVELSDLLCYFTDEGVARFWKWDTDGEFVAHARTDIPLLIERLEAAERLLAIAKKALEFYANEKTYERVTYGHDGDGYLATDAIVVEDDGVIAREALAALSGDGDGAGEVEVQE